MVSLPGLMPERDSLPSNTGEMAGEVTTCTPVTVLDVAWSDFDQVFYAKIKTPEGLEGWIPTTVVETTYAP